MATKKSTSSTRKAAPKKATAKPAPVRRRTDTKPSRLIKAQYSAIDRDRELRARLNVETRGEDDQLKGRLRNELLAVMRDNFRNAPEARAICEQRALNIIGDIGGKLQVTTPDEAFNREANQWFASRARRIEFSNGLHLNELLRRIQISLDVGGDLVVVADVATATAHAPFCGSGKLRVFDADEIGNLSEKDFSEKVGENYVQREGLIYDSLGRHCGVIVSTAERGKTTFSADSALVLMHDPDSIETPNWIYLQHAWRSNQGRGVSPFAPVTVSLHNIESIATSETAAAKLNSQMLGAYTRASENAGEDALPDALQKPVLIDENGMDASTGEAVDLEPAEPEVFPDEFARASGAFFDVLPDGYKVDLYKSERPNANMPAFLRFLSGRAAAALGMGVQYVTLDPLASYSAFRGAQVLARPAFRRAQKFLERNLCDWIAAVIIGEAIDAGFLAKPATDFRDHLFWVWPHQEECDSVNEQNTIRLRLQNGTTSYRELFGPNWKDRLAEIAEEAEACRAAGLIHPMTVTVAGATVSDDSTEPSDETTESP